MSDTSQLQLFISHASEDKPSFVRPLAEALKVHFKVWYDEYELTMGDSLLGKINTGLASCDYGVVVLSPAFFQKKWPKAELDGLFSLEQGNRKVILPIWKDIDAEGVAMYSPILAGRLAVPSLDGIDRVVAEIKRAVGVTERVREFSQFDALELRMKKLALNLATRTNAEKKLRTSEGVKEVEAEETKLCQLLQTQFEKVGATSSQLKCAFHRDMSGFQIRGPFRLRLGVRLGGHAMNNVTDTRLDCMIYQMGKGDDFVEMRPQPVTLRERAFRPYFGHDGEPVWTSPNSTEEFMTTQQVAVLLAENFIEFIERESRKP
ncbi:MAG TPA: toll/interleukin-1 receptor domain-containing protein [Lacunisphaera sp.]